MLLNRTFSLTLQIIIKSKLNFENGETKLKLFEEEQGISPGQACVFYSKDENGHKVLGGGWIAKN